MTRYKKQRLYIVLGTLACAAFSLTVLLICFQDAVLFFYTPSELVTKSQEQLARSFRLGGLVVENSVRYAVKDQTPTVYFEITDGVRSQNVFFSGVLPDLFREGQGVIAQGQLENPTALLKGEGTLFKAKTVLAKHDENYRPPELDKGLKRAKEKSLESLVLNGKTSQ